MVDFVSVCLAIAVGIMILDLFVRVLIGIGARYLGRIIRGE